MRIVRPRGRGRPIALHDNPRTVPWSKAVARAASVAMHEQRVSLYEGPVNAQVHFGLARPRTVKRWCPSVKPDLDKLVRAVLDALTGVVWRDDAQVITLGASKFYAEEPGAMVIVTAAEGRT